MLADAAERLAVAFRRAGFGEGDGNGELARENPLMAAIYAAAVQGRVALGEAASRRIARLGSAVLAAEVEETGSSRCATFGGFSLHAGVGVGAGDHAGLGRLCRYMDRPPLAADRLERLADGRILYRLRHRCRDGTSALVFEPPAFLAGIGRPERAPPKTGESGTAA